MAEMVATRQPVTFEPAEWLEVGPVLARFVFRGNDDARGAAGLAFGVTLSSIACRAERTSSRAALWLGPDEHLLLGPAQQGERIAQDLAAALSGRAHSLVDVSHRQVALQVQGARAEWLLEAQCPLPLNLRDFPVGMCTRTVYGKSEILLWRAQEQVFHLEVWRSFSQYVVELLREVAREER